MSSGSVGTFWWLSYKLRWGWRGIYSLHTKSNHYTHMSQLGQTDYMNSVRPKQFKMWTLGISVGPTETTRCDRCARARANINSVWPITSTRWDRSGVIGNRENDKQTRCDRFHWLGETERVKHVTVRMQGHLGETEIHIGVTELSRVLAVAMSSELGGAG